MTSPVVVSRIQNRRGTQDQFDALYPGQYTSAVGATSSGTTITVASTIGVYQDGVPSVIAGTGAFAPGTIVTNILSSTQFAVNLAPTTPLSGGAQVFIPAYNGQGGVSIAQYPNVLLPGEMALCTDTRNLYIGNVNGEYILYTASSGTSIILPPLVVVLDPAPTYTVIPELTYPATPFFNFLYDVTDSISSNWNSITGTSFARNGEMKITAVQSFADIPNVPYPPITPVDLTDNSVEVKNPATYTVEDISFIAKFNGLNIEISYKHNFPGSLTLSSTTIHWSPF